MEKRNVPTLVRKTGLWIGLLALIFAITFLIYPVTSENTPSLEAGLPTNALSVEEKSIPTNSIAVLPFTNKKSDANERYFIDGIQDDLIRHLSKVGELIVIARTSVQGFRATEKSIQEIATLLEVANILTADIEQIDNNLILQVQLIKANTGEVIWTTSYKETISTKHLFEIQIDIVKQIAGVLKTTIHPREQAALTEMVTDNLTAYEAYLKARQLMEIRNAISLKEAKILFETAINLDENFALAYIHLGSVYSLMAAYAGLDRTLAHRLAWENMERGMAINDHLADAYALKGILINNKDRDLEAASIAFEKGIALNPNYPATYHWYANTVRDLGRDFERASTIFQKAAQLNPLAPVILLNHSIYYAESGNGREAIRITKKGSRVEPGYPFFWMDLALNFTYEGELDSAAVYTHKGMQKNGVKGLFLRYYLEALQNLGMSKEIAKTLRNFTPITKQDSIVDLTAQLNVAYVQQNFVEAGILIDQMEKIRPRNSFALRHKYDYYRSAFQSVVYRYEQEYPNFLKGAQLSAYSMTALSRFQEYLFSLQQVGQNQKAKALWEKFSFLLVKKPEGKDEFKRNRKLRAIFRLRQTLMDGQTELALQQFADYFQEDYFDYVEEFEMDPAYAAIRTHPTYQQILAPVLAKVLAQRQSFEAYLINEVPYPLTVELD